MNTGLGVYYWLLFFGKACFECWWILGCGVSVDDLVTADQIRDEREWSMEIR